MAITTAAKIPSFESYGDYSSDNYGVNTLVFTDADGRNFYFSYRTVVAVTVPGKGKIVHQNYWGTTTGKHLNWIDGGDKEAKARRLSYEEFEATAKEWLQDG